MPSIRKDTPSTVEKGTQCSLICSSDCDQYNATISGDVCNLSIGPTVVYKLDPEATREILLGNSNHVDRLDYLARISTSTCNQMNLNKITSCTETQNDQQITEISISTQMQHLLNEIETPREAKRRRLRSMSPQTNQENKIRNDNVQTLFTYGIGGVVFNYIIRQRLRLVSRYH